MAFVSLFFVMLGIFALILLGIGTLGLIIIIVSIILRRKRKKEGKKPGKIGLIIGIIIFLIPVAIILSIMIPASISSFETQVERTQYTCLTDKWRNENDWVSDNDAKDEAIETLLKAADEGDVETLKQMFPQNAQGEQLDAQIEDFLTEYPKGLSVSENREEFSGSSTTKYFNTMYEIVMDGERYYIKLQACYRNDENPEEVGVTLFTVENEKAYALDKDYTDSDYIFSDTIVEEDYETRRIDAEPYVFTPIERTITQKEIESTLHSERSIASFIEKYGEPNVIKDYSNSNGTHYFYELVPDNEEPRYLEIVAVGDDIIIDLCNICGTEEDLLWFDDNGLLEKDE